MQTEWNICLFYYLKTGQINQGINFLNTREHDFLQHESGMEKDMRVCIYDSIFILYFIAGEHANSLKWVNKIITGDWSGRRDVQCFSLLLFLIIQFEKKNYELIEYTYKHTYRFITENMGTEGKEILLLRFLKKAILLNNNKELLPAFNNLKQELLNHKSKANHPNLFDSFELLLWIDSKIGKVSMKELYASTKSGCMQNETN